jgi:hypothetical protein
MSGLGNNLRGPAVRARKEVIKAIPLGRRRGTAFDNRAIGGRRKCSATIPNDFNIWIVSEGPPQQFERQVAAASNDDALH